MSVEKQSFRAGPFKEVFAQGVRVGGWLYLSGQVAMDASGAVVGQGDVVAQLIQCYVNVKGVLAEFGAGMENLIDETIYVTDIGDVMEKLDAFLGARRECFGQVPEVTQTLVETSSLVMPELLVEIKCVARL